MAKNKVEDLQSKKVCADSRTLFAGAGGQMTPQSAPIREFQRRKLAQLRTASFAPSPYEGKVTLLIYTFPQNPDGADFDWIEFSILQSWSVLGKLKTVIVANSRFAKLDAFAAVHPEVEIQLAPNLKPGDLDSMSRDMLANLWRRFSTPEVLVIQDDGFPLGGNLGDFLGKFDFIGAPIYAPGLRRKLFYAVHLPCFNGGFSLRSRRFCRYVSRFWCLFARFFIRPGSFLSGEDVVFCFLSRLNPYAYFKFKMPGERDALRFSVDTLGGILPLPGKRPFGFHGKATFDALEKRKTGRLDEVTVLAYHFWDEARYESEFARLAHSFEETWRFCGELESVIVANKVEKCLEDFAAAHRNLKIQVEPSLVPGRIFTMSADMNGKLYTRFNTPYVLIIQNDGYPLRSGLEEFVGKWDFIGAPYIGLQWWKRLVAGLANYHVQNGGFSLRSREICEAAAKLWNEKYRKLGDCTAASEDIFYTSTLVRREPAYRRKFRFATSRESLEFSWDASVPVPMPSKLPFGFHCDKSLAALNLRHAV